MSFPPLIGKESAREGYSSIILPCLIGGSEQWERPSLKDLATYVLGVQWYGLDEEVWLSSTGNPLNGWYLQTQPNMALAVWKTCKWKSLVTRQYSWSSFDRDLYLYPKTAQSTRTGDVWHTSEGKGEFSDSKLQDRLVLDWFPSIHEVYKQNPAVTANNNQWLHHQQSLTDRNLDLQAHSTIKVPRSSQSYWWKSYFCPKMT